MVRRSPVWPLWHIWLPRSGVEQGSTLQRHVGGQAAGAARLHRHAERGNESGIRPLLPWLAGAARRLRGRAAAAHTGGAAPRPSTCPHRPGPARRTSRGPSRVRWSPFASGPTGAPSARARCAPSSRSTGATRDQGLRILAVNVRQDARRPRPSSSPWGSPTRCCSTGTDPWRGTTGSAACRPPSSSTARAGSPPASSASRPRRSSSRLSRTLCLPVNTDLTLPLAFAHRGPGALHCLGMCSGIAGGYFVRLRQRRRCRARLPRRAHPGLRGPRHRRRPGRPGAGPARDARQGTRPGHDGRGAGHHRGWPQAYSGPLPGVWRGPARHDGETASPGGQTHQHSDPPRALAGGPRRAPSTAWSPAA